MRWRRCHHCRWMHWRKGSDGQSSGAGGCSGGKSRTEHGAALERHYKFCVAAINLGGWTKRIRYVYEWNMWNMPAWLVLACEVDRLTHEQLTEEEQIWAPPEDSAAVQRPPQGFSSEGRVRRWVAFQNMRGCAVFGLVNRVHSPRRTTTFKRSRVESGRASCLCAPAGTRFDSRESCMVVFHLHNDHAQRNGEPRERLYRSLVECCDGGVRIVAGDLHMAFRGLIRKLPNEALGSTSLRITVNGTYCKTSGSWTPWAYGLPDPCRIQANSSQ